MQTYYEKDGQRYWQCCLCEKENLCIDKIPGTHITIGATIVAIACDTCAPLIRAQLEEMPGAMRNNH